MTKYRVQVEVEHKADAENVAEAIENVLWELIPDGAEILVIPLEE